jgi:hypothetical protein
MATLYCLSGEEKVKKRNISLFFELLFTLIHTQGPVKKTANPKSNSAERYAVNPAPQTA